MDESGSKGYCSRCGVVWLYQVVWWKPSLARFKGMLAFRVQWRERGGACAAGERKSLA